MVRQTPLGTVALFVGLYLVLSLPPFVLIRPPLSPALSEVATLAILGTAGIVVVLGVILARDGVRRYTAFLLAPTDALSILVSLAFVWAAVSWWAVPELTERLEMGLAFGEVLTVILVVHLPMVLGLSLLTAIGKAHT